MKRGFYSFLLLLFTFCQSFLGSAGTEADRGSKFHRANELLQNDNAVAAICEYEKIGEDFRGANLFYNLAIAQAKNHDLAAAMVNFYRAFVANPLDPRHYETLRRLQGELNFAFPQISPIQRLGYGLDRNDWILTSIVGLWLFLLALTSFLFASRHRFLKFLLFVAFSLPLLAGINGILQSIELAKTFVVSDNIPIYSLPNEGSTVKKILRPGEILRRCETHGAFLLVDLGDGDRGYILSRQMLPIFDGPNWAEK